MPPAANASDRPTQEAPANPAADPASPNFDPTRAFPGRAEGALAHRVTELDALLDKVRMGKRARAQISEALNRVERLAVLYARQIDATAQPVEPFEKCACGRCYTRESWAALKFCGVVDFEEDGVFEQRDCLCGSTRGTRLGPSTSRTAKAVHLFFQAQMQEPPMPAEEIKKLLDLDDIRACLVLPADS